MTNKEISIHSCNLKEDFEIAKSITKDYMLWLGMDLSFQNTDKELQIFSTMYGLPSGAYIYAKMGGRVAGGVGVRYLTSDICEMKRLYVYEEYRYQGIASLLCSKIISISKDLSYSCMRLDTVSKLVEANSLYDKLGFKDIPKYYDNPDLTVRYMELTL